jgi:hypothetical protein
VGGFELAQLLDQAVVLGVRHLRPVVEVIAAVVVGDQPAKLFDAASGLGHGLQDSTAAGVRRRPAP